MYGILKIYRLIIITLLLSSTVFSKGKISGEVKNSRGAFVVNATVRLEPYDYGENIIYETTTNGAGEFSIKKIKNGTYVLKININYGNYAPFSKTVRIDGGLIFNQDKKEFNIILKPKLTQKTDEPLIENEIFNTIILTILYLAGIAGLSFGGVAVFRYLKKLNLYNKLKERIKRSKSSPKKEKGLLSNGWLRVKNYFIALLIKYKNNAAKNRLKKAEKKRLRLERVKEKRLEKAEKKRLRLERAEEKQLERAEKKRLLLENVKKSWLERGERKRIEKTEQRLLKLEKYKIKMQLKTEKMRLKHEKNKENIQEKNTVYTVKYPVKRLDDVQPNEKTSTFIYRLILFTSIIYCYYTVWLDNTGFFVMFSPNIMKGELWRLVTPIFAHFDLSHIVGNMFTLYLISKMCAILYTRNQFVKAYLLLGIAGLNLYQKQEIK